MLAEKVQGDEGGNLDEGVVGYGHWKGMICVRRDMAEFKRAGCSSCLDGGGRWSSLKLGV